MMRERSSLTLYSSLMNNWEKELCTCEARRAITWWKLGVWRLLVGTTNRGFAPYVI
jgi:hypothetical protein